MSASAAAASAGLIRTIQPPAYGSLLTSSVASASAPLTAMTSPATGAKRSLAVFTDSMTPSVSSWASVRPISGSSTKTMSPSSSAA